MTFTLYSAFEQDLLSGYTALYKGFRYYLLLFIIIMNLCRQFTYLCLLSSANIVS